MRGTHCDRDIRLKRAKCFRNDTAVCVCGGSRVRPLEMASCVAERWSPAGPVSSTKDHSVWLSTVHAGPFPSVPGLRAHQNIDHPVEIVEE